MELESLSGEAHAIQEGRPVIQGWFVRLRKRFPTGTNRWTRAVLIAVSVLTLLFSAVAFYFLRGNTRTFELEFDGMFLRCFV
jgi:hypothetical protein